jgi:hypothetical protein
VQIIPRDEEKLTKDENAEESIMSPSLAAADSPPTSNSTSTFKLNTTSSSDVEEEFEVEILSNHAARIAFLRSLNLQRSKRQDAGIIGFERLARVLWWMLDACETQEDVCCARMVMVMAETFFELVPSKGKRFLQAVLKAHSVWTHEAYWEEVFYQSFYDAVKVTSNPYGGTGTGGGGGGGRAGQASPDSSSERSNQESTGYAEAIDNTGDDNVPLSPPPAPQGGGGNNYSISAPSPSHRPGTTDWSYAYVQTLFSQLAAIAMNMITFGLPPERVARIIASLAIGNGLPVEMTAALQETVKTYSSQE